MSYSEKILQYRRERNLSQEQLALEIGTTRQAVSRWETGLSVPSFKYILKLCSFFGVSVSQFIGDEEENNYTDADFNLYLCQYKNKSFLFKGISSFITILFSLLPYFFHDYSTKLILLWIYILLITFLVFFEIYYAREISLENNNNKLYNTSVYQIRFTTYNIILWGLITNLFYYALLKYMDMYILFLACIIAGASVSKFIGINIDIILKRRLGKKWMVVEDNKNLRTLNIVYLVLSFISISVYIFLLIMVYYIWQSYIYVWDIYLAFLIFVILSSITLIIYRVGCHNILRKTNEIS